jgi:roadblock/LC7 domain-containing protein
MATASDNVYGAFAGVLWVCFLGAIYVGGKYVVPLVPHAAVWVTHLAT